MGHFRVGACVLAVVLLMGSGVSLAAGVELFPKDKAEEVNPDAHLVVTFGSVPALGKAGKIRVFDAGDDSLVDTLDLNIPDGPAVGGPKPPAAPYTTKPYDYSGPHLTNATAKAGTPSGEGAATSTDMQLTIIGGFTDGFHFHPIIIHDKTATIYLHNNLLAYGKRYYVQMDPGVLTVSDGNFTGIEGKSGWTFATKKEGPPADAERVVVAADGSGDFNTVQGAMDFVPDNGEKRGDKRITIFIKNGTYEEIVYFRNKSNVMIMGEDREKVQVGYANNEVFNPHPVNVGTNEYPGTFPSRRAAFMVDHSTGIELANFSVATYLKGQAEGLLIVGGKNVVNHMNVTGSGDAIQVNDSAYVVDSMIVGDGDTLLGRGPVFFERCDFKSAGAFMWVRSTLASHGCVCVECKFEPTGSQTPVIARAPSNNGKGYPNTEVVLIRCLLGNVSPELWGPLGGDTLAMHYWEFDSRNISDGKPVDVSKRNPASKQLTMEKDGKVIADYSDPAFVLGGWKPEVTAVNPK